MITARPRGGTGDVKYHQGAEGDYVTRRGQGAARHARLQPEPSGVRRSRRRRSHARRSDRARQPAGEALPAAGAADPDPRRRRLPRRGRGRGDAQPRGAGGLLHRRRDPHHRQQPDRLHDRAGGVAFHALRVRPREGLRHADHPRERRRPRGLHLRRAARDGVPRGVPPGRRDRPDRLPALRPQRDRRAGVHPAAHVRRDPQAPVGAQALRRPPGRAGDGRAGGAGPPAEGGARASSPGRTSASATRVAGP